MPKTIASRLRGTREEGEVELFSRKKKTDRPQATFLATTLSEKLVEKIEG